jgi:molecular chaperone DnaJ
MGLPRLESDRRGDQLVRVRVWVPKRLTAEERARLEELRASENLAPPGEEGGFWRKVREAFTA